MKAERCSYLRAVHSLNDAIQAIGACVHDRADEVEQMLFDYMHLAERHATQCPPSQSRQADFQMNALRAVLTEFETGGFRNPTERVGFVEDDDEQA